MIVYASRTGNVRYIASKLRANTMEINEKLILNTPYLLITYTDGLGDIPAEITHFLEHNANYCKGVIVSGNKNFGHTAFAGAGDKIAAKYHIPLVRKLDLRGFQVDYEAIQNFYETRVIGSENLFEVK